MKKTLNLIAFSSSLLLLSACSFSWAPADDEWSSNGSLSQSNDSIQINQEDTTPINIDNLTWESQTMDGYTLDLPTDWVISSGAEVGMDLVVIPSALTNGIIANTTIFVEEYDGDQEKYKETILSILTQNMEQLNILEQDTDIIDNRWHIIYTGTFQWQLLVRSQEVIFADKEVYIMTSTMDQAWRDQYQDVIENIQQSLVIA